MSAVVPRVRLTDVQIASAAFALVVDDAGDFEWASTWEAAEVADALRRLADNVEAGAFGSVTS